MFDMRPALSDMCSHVLQFGTLIWIHPSRLTFGNLWLGDAHTSRRSPDPVRVRVRMAVARCRIFCSEEIVLSHFELLCRRARDHCCANTFCLSMLALVPLDAFEATSNDLLIFGTWEDK